MDEEMWNAFERSRQNLYINFIIIYFSGDAPKNGAQAIKELGFKSEYDLTRFKNVYDLNRFKNAFGTGSAINDSYRV